MSDNSERLPPARARSRASGRGESRQSAREEFPDDQELGPQPVRSVFRLSDYVSQSENISTLVELKERVEEALWPRDFIERLWIDEFVILEWELHRLRSAKKAAIERDFADVLLRRLIEGIGIAISDEDRALYSDITDAAHGDAEARARWQERMGADALHIPQRVINSSYLDNLDIHLGLEKAILACSQRRDAILMKLTMRREFLDGQRRRSRDLPSP